MYESKTMYGRIDTIYEYEDFEVGDKVALLPNRPRYCKAPIYLEDYNLYVAGKGRKHIKIATDAFPNESWSVDPCFLRKL